MLQVFLTVFSWITSVDPEEEPTMDGVSSLTNGQDHQTIWILAIVLIGVLVIVAVMFVIAFRRRIKYVFYIFLSSKLGLLIDYFIFIITARRRTSFSTWSRTLSLPAPRKLLSSHVLAMAFMVVVEFTMPFCSPSSRLKSDPDSART